MADLSPVGNVNIVSPISTFLLLKYIDTQIKFIFFCFFFLFLGLGGGEGGAKWDTRIPRRGPLKQKMGTQPITMLYCADWIF